MQARKMPTPVKKQPADKDMLLTGRSEARQQKISALRYKSKHLKPLPVDLALQVRPHVPAILARLLQLAQDDHGPTAVKACALLLDRCFGRAPITIDVTKTLTDNTQLANAAAAILLKREQLQIDSNNVSDTADGSATLRLR